MLMKFFGGVGCRTSSRWCRFWWWSGLHCGYRDLLNRLLTTVG